MRCAESRWLAVLGYIALLVALPARAQDERTLTVFSALSEDHLSRYATVFQAAHPGVRIVWVRAATGILTEKILSQATRPEGDAVFGLAATSMARLADAGVLEGYAPAGLEHLSPRFRDAADPPLWVGMNAWIGAVCVNTVELAARKLPAPRTWKELAATTYRGLISAPSPVTSGTGYLHLSAWVQLMGEASAWDFMERLHRNVKTYTERGDTPCTQAARGEVALGISFAHRGVKSLQQGAPVQILLPSEGVGWDVGASGVLRGARNPDAARRLVDWSVSTEANALYSESYTVIGVQDLARQVKGIPAGITQAMIPNDLRWASQNRNRLLAEWKRRFVGQDPE